MIFLQYSIPINGAGDTIGGPEMAYVVKPANETNSKSGY